MPNDYAGMRDEYDRRFDSPKPRTDWIPFKGELTQKCERCGRVPKPPDFICAGLCKKCNDAYCEESEGDDGPSMINRSTAIEWTDAEWAMYARFN